MAQLAHVLIFTKLRNILFAADLPLGFKAARHLREFSPNTTAQLLNFVFG
jgi:hypothetical protein